MPAWGYREPHRSAKGSQNLGCTCFGDRGRNRGQWFGRQCTQGKVLIIDNELWHDELADRLRRICAAQTFPMESLNDQMIALPLHGRCVDIHAIAEYLLAKPPGEFSLIVLDALYLAPAGGNG